MKFLVTLLLMVGFIGFQLQAQSRNIEQAQALALSFLGNSSGTQQRIAPDKDVLVPVELVQQSESPSVYVFNIPGDKGFVIVSGDQRARDILAYSDQRAFDPVHIPDNLRYWLSVYEDEIAFLRRSDAQVEKIGANITLQAVAPLLGKVKWDQGSPYNLLCPVINQEQATRAVTGCVATGMAQVMFYHRWPVQGIGSNSYTTETLKIPLSVNFSQTTYDWDNMTPTYSASSTEVQKTAVATLMYHAGVAVNMDYNTESAAYFTNMGRAMYERFGYDEDLQLVNRDYFSRQDWQQLLLAELYAARPILYGGTSSGGSGHLWVCDGVDQNGYYHFNWGWGGMSDGYFAISALNPSALGTGGGTGGFNYYQQATVGVQRPDNSSQPRLSVYMNNADITSASALKRTETFNVTYRQLYNRGLWTVNVQPAIGLYNGNTLISILKNYQQNDLATNWGWANMAFNTLSVPAQLAAGNYQLKPLIRRVGQSNWETLPVRIGAAPYFNVRLTTDSVFLSLPQPGAAQLVLEELKTIGNLYQNRTGRYSVTLLNNGLEYNSAVKIALTPVIPGAVFETSGELINLVNGATETVVFSGNLTVAPGEYWMSVQFDAANNYGSPVYQALGAPVKVNVLATPVTPPVLTLTEAISFPDNSSVVKSQASLKAKIHNSGGLFEEKVIAFIFPMTAGNSLTYIGYQTAIIDTNETATLYFNGNINLNNGNYRVGLYYQNSGWKQFDPGSYSLLTFTLVDDPGTSVSLLQSGVLAVYPNPATELLRVMIPDGIERISIYSTDGRRVYSQIVKGTEQVQVAISDWQAGVYVIRAEGSGQESVMRRFIKE